MATVVIIHAAEDTLPARALAEKLRQAKLTVTLEHPLGDPLREAVKNAQVTVALWSPRAVAQPTIVEEVQAAKGKSKVVHALMQSAAIPEQFRGEQPVNLTGWRGEDDFAPWRDLAKLVTSKAGVANLPPPAPKPPSGFFQPGRPDAGAAGQPAPRQAARPQQQQQRAQQPARPQQQQRPQQAAPRPAPRPAPQTSAPAEARSGGGGRGMLIAIIALVVVGVAGGGGYWYFTQSQGAQATSLEQIDLTSAAAIRDFLASNPSAAEREQAREALATLEQQTLDAARDANTIEAFEQFLRDFPDSEEAVFVQGQIQQLRLLEAEGAQDAPPETATGAPITELPADPDLVPPGAAPDADNGPAVITPPAEPPPVQGPTPG
jgi:hypothetical protein